MATLLEIATIKTNSGWGDFHNKVLASVAIKAYNIAEEATPTAEAVLWAKKALLSPHKEAEIVENYVIAANSSASIAQIFAASDASIQSNVNTAVDDLLGA